jgi:hypothetical protein
MAKKRRQVKESNPGDTRFNVKTPLNMRGKNHGRQPVRTSLYRESGYNANDDGLQEESKSISNEKPY